MKFLHPEIKKKIFRLFKSKLGEERTRRLQYLPFQTVNKLKKPPFVRVGNCSYVPGKGFFLNGWLIEGRHPVVSMSIAFAEHDIPVGEHLFRIPRLDIQSKYALQQGSKPGFVTYVRSAIEPVSVPAKAKLKLTLSSGKTITRRIRIDHVSSKPLPSIQKLLNAIPGNLEQKRQCFDAAYGPAIKDMWEYRGHTETSAEKVSYNDEFAAEKPEVSLIIPIYGRFDFMEYQLCQFVNDPAMHRYEIIYVIDDPRITEQVRSASETYSRIFRIPFNVLYLRENLGFAGANNAGVKVATSDTVLLLNSDVMPASSGWLEEFLATSKDVLPNSLIGARLLYEDDSIQHDGMAFYQSPFVDNLWTNIHPGKGLPIMLADQFAKSKSTDSAVSSVEAITGACMLMTRSNYMKLGGLDENYILGDYEDSDFCMKAHESGLGIKMNRTTALYHLERQSQSLVTGDRWKAELTYYNCWYHTQKWHDRIVALQQGTQDIAEYREIA